MRNTVALLAAVALGVTAQAETSGGVPAASVDAIAIAVDACRAATTRKSIDVNVLKQKGFAASSWRGPSGRPVQNAPRVFGKDGALILLTDDGHDCTIMAGLKASSDWMALNIKLNATLGVAPFETKLGQTSWRVADHAIQLAATGSREKPAVRVMIIPNSQEPK